MKIITKKKQEEIDKTMIEKIVFAVKISLRDTNYIKAGG
jgi:hypothetical protein